MSRPTRLARRKGSAHAFLNSLPKKYQRRVVAVSSQPQVVSAATDDREYVNEAVSALRPRGARRSGNGLANAILVASGTPPRTTKPPAPDAGAAAILVLSDGAQGRAGCSCPDAIHRRGSQNPHLHGPARHGQTASSTCRSSAAYNEQIRVAPDATAMRTVGRQRAASS